MAIAFGRSGGLIEETILKDRVGNPLGRFIGLSSNSITVYGDAW